MNPILIGLWWSKILYTSALESGTTYALIQMTSTEHQINLRLRARQSVQCQRSPDRTATPTEFVAWWQKWQRNGSSHCDSAGTLAEKAKSLVRVYRHGQLTKTWDARSVFPELAFIARPGRQEGDILGRVGSTGGRRRCWSKATWAGEGRGRSSQELEESRNKDAERSNSNQILSGLQPAVRSLGHFNKARKEHH